MSIFDGSLDVHNQRVEFLPIDASGEWELLISSDFPDDVSRGKPQQHHARFLIEFPGGINTKDLGYDNLQHQESLTVAAQAACSDAIMLGIGTMKMHLRLITMPEDGAEPGGLVTLSQLAPNRNRRHFLCFGSDDISTLLDAANHTEAGSPQTFLTGYRLQAYQYIVTVIEASHNDPPRLTYLILHISPHKWKQLSKICAYSYPGQYSNSCDAAQQCQAKIKIVFTSALVIAD